MHNGTSPENSEPWHPVQLYDVVAEHLSITRYEPAAEMALEISANATVVEIEAKDDLRGVCEVDVKIVGRGPELAAIEIAVRLRGYFALMGDYTGDQLEQFLMNQGIMLLWPYVREAATNLTTRVGLIGFMLPLLDVTRVGPEFRATGRAHLVVRGD